MDHFPTKLNTMAQVNSECTADAKSRFSQMGNYPLPKTEVICPQPRRATRALGFLESLNRPAPKPKSIIPTRVDFGPDILDNILSKDESDSDWEGGNQAGFFCGSPPVRTNNPVVRDAQFDKQTHFSSSPLGNLQGMKLRCERGGSPSCASSFGGSPKVRVEGFALA